MFFHIRTEVDLPPLDPEVRADLLERDRAYTAGWTLTHAVGANIEFALIDAPDAEALHALLNSRPVAAYARTEVTAVRAPHIPQPQRPA
ncbi:muconolactone Delta-isomerase family protein [Corynebacterium tapiri]|uniref:Muconolactone isomerase domain-containing protein n=1 Tax=Corynebacterium tapiri TaxID=1448266 RepID=A0A5C4U2E3_9CORY|nr:muconolactone Delta-isomerase family protein [Corynebacterium tapiri]TNL96664.1 hypothetical protein FHE74_08175 [Corynebacterium tapiri]